MTAVSPMVSAPYQSAGIFGARSKVFEYSRVCGADEVRGRNQPGLGTAGEILCLHLKSGTVGSVWLDGQQVYNSIWKN